MHALSVFWFLWLRQVRNRFFSSPKQVFGSLFSFFVVLVLFFLASNFVSRFLFLRLEYEELRALSPFFVVLGTSWVSLLVFTESMNRLVPGFYKAQDLPYLMSLPLSTKSVLAYRYILHLITAVFHGTILPFPFWLSLGRELGAAWSFYLFIPLVLCIASVIPSVAGLWIGMMGLRWMGRKTFMAVVSVAGIALSMIMPIFIFGMGVDMAPRILALASRLHTPLIRYLLGLFSGVSPMMGSLQGAFWVPVFQLLLLAFFSFFIATLSLFLLAPTFLHGWHTMQQHTENKKQKVSQEVRGEEVCVPFRLAKTLWLLASRNQECLMGSIVLLLGFVATVFLGVRGVLFPENPLLAFLIITLGGSLVTSMAYQIPLTPLEVVADEKLIKGQYWLFKVAPLQGQEVLQAYIIAVGLPAMLTVLLASLLFVFFRYDIRYALYALLISLLFPLGNTIAYQASSFLSLRYDRMPLNVVFSLLPFFLAALFAGPLLLPAIWTALPQGSLGLRLGISSVLILSTILLLFRAQRQVWEELEL